MSCCIINFTNFSKLNLDHHQVTSLKAILIPNIHKNLIIRVNRFHYEELFIAILKLTNMIENRPFEYERLIDE